MIGQETYQPTNQSINHYFAVLGTNRGPIETIKAYSNASGTVKSWGQLRAKSQNIVHAIFGQSAGRSYRKIQSKVSFCIDTTGRVIEQNSYASLHNLPACHESSS